MSIVTLPKVVLTGPVRRGTKGSAEFQEHGGHIEHPAG